jgi:diguanylate cyclase (GGDEF)-like protein
MNIALMFAKLNNHEPRGATSVGRKVVQASSVVSSTAPSRDVSIYVQQLMTCLRIGKALTSTFNMEQILVIVLKRLSELFKARNWTLFLLDHDREELHFEVVVGLDKRSLSDVRIKVGEGIAGTAAVRGEPILVPDVSSDPRFSKRVDDLTGFITRSLICLPLKMQGSVIGVIEVVNPEDPSLFQPEFMPVLAILADYVAIAINNSRNYRKIESLVITDDVTGFHNTRFLHQHLERLLDPAATIPQEVSLVFLDLDNFKQVVDAYGHLVGSQVLREVARTMAATLNGADRLVRYGGDEFVIILPGQDKKAALDKVVAVRQALAQTVFLREEGLEVKLTASFGVATYPDDAASKKELLRIADNSMYRSKEIGKNAITLA